MANDQVHWLFYWGKTQPTKLSYVIGFQSETIYLESQLFALLNFRLSSALPTWLSPMSGQTFHRWKFPNPLNL